MTVHNGELFLEDQLNSILPYLKLGDEVVISDDDSQDDTLEIIKSFNDPRIRLLKPKSFGDPTKNFEYALSHCANEIIFLADQDDIWYPEKISQMTKALDKADLAICDCRLVDEHGKEIAPSFFALNRSKKGLVKNFIRNSFVGCCMAFHRRVLERALPFPEKIPAHDLWIGLVAQKYFRVNFIPTILVDYRRHQQNFSTTGHPSKNSLRKKIKSRYELAKLLLAR